MERYFLIVEDQEYVIIRVSVDDIASFKANYGDKILCEGSGLQDLIQRLIEDFSPLENESTTHSCNPS